MNTQQNGNTFTTSNTGQSRNVKAETRTGIAVRRDARRMRRAIRAI